MGPLPHLLGPPSRIVPRAGVSRQAARPGAPLAPQSGPLVRSHPASPEQSLLAVLAAPSPFVALLLTPSGGTWLVSVCARRRRLSLPLVAMHGFRRGASRSARTRAGRPAVALPFARCAAATSPAACKAPRVATRGQGTNKSKSNSKNTRPPQVIAWSHARKGRYAPLRGWATERPKP